MGRFIYQGGPRVEMEDRALLHLQTAIVAKLRHGEPFAFTWKEDASVGGGRTTVWIHPFADLVFKFAGPRSADLNRAWIRDLMVTASQTSGLYLTPEPRDFEPSHRSGARERELV